MGKNKTTKTKQARLGEVFYSKLEMIKDKRLLKTIREGTSKDRLSTEKITNLIVKHKHWKQIEQDIIEATQEEVDKHGSE